MKKYLLIFASLVMSLTLCFCMTGCDDSSNVSEQGILLPADEFDDPVSSKSISNKIDEIDELVSNGVKTDEDKVKFQEAATYVAYNLPGASSVLSGYIATGDEEPRTDYENLNIEELREKLEEYKETETETESSEVTESQEESSTTESDVLPTEYTEQGIELPKIPINGKKKINN